MMITFDDFTLMLIPKFHDDSNDDFRIDVNSCIMFATCKEAHF